MIKINKIKTNFKKILPFAFALVVIVGVMVMFAPQAHAGAAITSITVTSPNTTVKWSGIHNITWTSTGNEDGVDTVRIYYCKGVSCDDNSYTLIIAGVADDSDAPGSYAWNTAGGGFTDATTYKIRVAATSDPNINDNSDTTFTVDNTVPLISISDDASGSWTNSDTIAVTTSDATAGLLETKWVVQAGAVCGAGQDAALDAGTAGISMVADDDAIYQNQYICFRSKDNADTANKNYAISAQITKLDTTKPTVVLSHDHADLIVRDADTDLITATFTDVNSISGTPAITIGSIIIGINMATTADPLIWEYEWDVPAGNDGVQAISVSAFDPAGNPNDAATGVISLTIDNTAPIVVFTAPEASASVKANTIFTFSNTETTAPECNINEGAWESCVSGDAFSTLSDFAGFGQIAFIVNLRDTDVAGNVATTTSRSFVKDTVAPIVEITAPLTGAIVKGSAAVTFTDNELTAAECSINDSDWVTCTTGTTTLSDITGFNALGQGVFTLYLRDTDAAGNVGTDNEIDIIKDTVVPTVVLSHDHADLIVRDADTDLITATFTDVNSISGTPAITIGSIIIGINMATTADPLIWEYEWDVPAGNDGVQAISVSAFDPAGNPNDAATGVISLTIDNTAPTYSVAYTVGVNPVTNIKVSDDVLITVTFNEDMAAVPLPKIQLGGAANPLGATEMTLVSAISYTYEWFTDQTGNGVMTPIVTVGTDVAENLVTETSSTKTTITVDNIAPTLPSAGIVGTAIQGANDTITLTFSDTNAVSADDGDWTNCNEISAIQSPGGIAKTLVGATCAYATSTKTLTITLAKDAADAETYLVSGSSIVITPAADKIRDAAGNFMATTPVTSATNVSGVCAISSVTYGTVSAYPSCTITCNSGYTKSGNSCIYSGGGGGGGYTPSTTTTTTTTTTTKPVTTTTTTKPISQMTPQELQAEIIRFTALITQLQSQLKGMVSGPSALSSIPESFKFTQNLQFGQTLIDVKYLQIVLNSDSATMVASTGSGSPGKETTYFGPLTKAAVIKFQEKYKANILTPLGLTKGTGFVSTYTRIKLNALLGR